MTHAEALLANQVLATQVCLYDGRKCEVVECGNDGVIIIDTLNDPDGLDCFLVPWAEVAEAPIRLLS